MDGRGIIGLVLAGLLYFIGTGFAKGKWPLSFDGLLKEAFAWVYGRQFMLPNRYLEECANDKRLNFTESFKRDFNTGIKGIEPRCGEVDEELLQSLPRGLSSQLTPMVPCLNEEAAWFMSQKVNSGQDLPLAPTVSRLMAHLLARAFVGRPLCRNDRWIDLSLAYTMQRVHVMSTMALWPWWLHDFIHRFLPACRQLRSLVYQARQVMEPALARRRQQRKDGDTPQDNNNFVDTIAWTENRAAKQGRPLDITLAQLRLAFSAMLGVSDLLAKVIKVLATQDDLLPRVRQEMKAVVAEHGRTRAALQHMVVTDALLKETQRLHHPSPFAASRLAAEQVQLSDGTVIPKGASVRITTENMRDESVYAHADEFNLERWMTDSNDDPSRRRAAMFACPSPDHSAFGYGVHACPGRYLAEIVLKVALCHLILTYDLELETPGLKTKYAWGINKDTETLLRLRPLEG